MISKEDLSQATEAAPGARPRRRHHARGKHGDAAEQKLERQAIKLDETARRLGVSRNSAYAAARRGQIPTIRIGRLLLVPLAALERMLDVQAS